MKKDVNNSKISCKRHVQSTDFNRGDYSAILCMFIQASHCVQQGLLLGKYAKDFSVQHILKPLIQTKKNEECLTLSRFVFENEFYVFVQVGSFCQDSVSFCSWRSRR